MNEKYKNLASNTVVFAVGNAFSKAIQFVLLPVYTAYMTEAAYGMGELLSGLTQLVYPVITLCLYEALFRFVLDRDGNPKVIFSTVMLLVCALIPFALVVGLLLEIVINAESSFLCALLSVTSALRLCFMILLVAWGREEICAFGYSQYNGVARWCTGLYLLFGNGSFRLSA